MARPEFTHPVLRMMGIPRLRVPSRNWSIFWALTGSIAGGIWYDRRERRRVRQEWKDKVSHLANVPISALELPRKVTVYIAPPPNDYLDATLKHFRDYIKPILTAAAVDYEVVEENQQGTIRYKVAEDIRNERRERAGLPTSGYQKDELDNRIDSRVSRDLTGGVLCVGRGAYKEYLSGVQEGYMGPLEEPAFIKEEAEAKKALALAKAAEESADKPAEAAADVSASENSAETVAVDSIESSNESADTVAEPAKPQETQSADQEKEEKKKEPRAPESWLRAEHYDEAKVDDTFYTANLQPFGVFRHPQLLGILNTPWRIVRFFNQRKLANEMGELTAAVVLCQTRPFVPEDADLAISDESDWPSSWKQNGRDANSEWMREFKVDPRIAARLEVYDPKAPASEQSSNQ